MSPHGEVGPSGILTPPGVRYTSAELHWMCPFEKQDSLGWWQPDESQNPSTTSPMRPLGPLNGLRKRGVFGSCHWGVQGRAGSVRPQQSPNRPPRTQLLPLQFSSPLLRAGPVQRQVRPQNLSLSATTDLHASSGLYSEVREVWSLLSVRFMA